MEEEERVVLHKCFNLIDLHGKDGVTSVSSFIEFLDRQIKTADLDSAAYSNLTSEKLQGRVVREMAGRQRTLIYMYNPKLAGLFAMLDPAVGQCDVHHDSVSFELFLTIMDKNRSWSNADKEALGKN